MALAADELLASLAVTLREQIGPAVQDSYAKTQAFMAAVIMEKLSGQLHAASAGEPDGERLALIAELGADLALPPRVRAAVTALAAGGTDATWGELVAALYAERKELGDERFEWLRTRVRAALRVRLDRVLAYAS